MIKGGFQGLDISGVDLTAESPLLPGAYAACAAADGKPIRVLTADGAVQCSVKKVSTNYVLAGVTGDGKILSITVGSTDGISVSEIVPGDTGSAEYLGFPYDISQATTSDPYITGYDGIVKLSNGASDPTTSLATIVTYTGPSGTSSIVLLHLPSGALSNEETVCFVKKGTKLACTGVAVGLNFKFYPYKPVQS